MTCEGLAPGSLASTDAGWFNLPYSTEGITHGMQHIDIDEEISLVERVCDRGVEDQVVFLDPPHVYAAWAYDL